MRSLLFSFSLNHGTRAAGDAAASRDKRGHMPTEENSTDSMADCKLQSIHRVKITRLLILIYRARHEFIVRQGTVPKGKKLDSTHFLPSAFRNFLSLHYPSYLGLLERDCLYFFHRNYFRRQMYTAKQLYFALAMNASTGKKKRSGIRVKTKWYDKHVSTSGGRVSLLAQSVLRAAIYV